MNRRAALILNRSKYWKRWQYTELLLRLVIVLNRTYCHCLLLTIYHQLYDNLVPLVPVVECAAHEQWLFLLFVRNPDCNASSKALIIRAFLWIQNYSPVMHSKHYWIRTINDTLFQELERILTCWLHYVPRLDIKLWRIQSSHFRYFSKFPICYSHSNPIFCWWIQSLDEPFPCVILYLFENFLSFHFEPHSILDFILQCLVRQVQESKLNFIMRWVKL